MSQDYPKSDFISRYRSYDRQYVAIPNSIFDSKLISETTKMWLIRLLANEKFPETATELPLSEAKRKLVHNEAVAAGFLVEVTDYDADGSVIGTAFEFCENPIPLKKSAA